jgi:hypothetical protein
LVIEGEKDIPSKILKFIQATEAVNQLFRPWLVQNFGKICVGQPVCMWNLDGDNLDGKRLLALEMKFMAADYIF